MMPNPSDLDYLLIAILIVILILIHPLARKKNFAAPRFSPLAAHPTIVYCCRML